jgi:amino acid transporter
MRILVQFISQAIGVVLLRKRKGIKELPFKMWLYPLPVIVSVIFWLFVFFATGWFALWGSLLVVSGWVVYLVKLRIEKSKRFTAESV